MSSGRPALAGLLFAVLAALFFSTMNSLVKLAGPYLGVWQTGVGRFVVGLIALPVLAAWLGFSLRFKNPVLLLIRSVSGAAAFILMVIAFRTIPLSVGMALFYLYPVFCALLGPTLVGDKTPLKEWPLIGGAFVGAAVILWPDKLGDGLAVGHFLILLASLMASVAIVLVRRLVVENNPWTIYFNFCLVGTIACGAPLLSGSGPILPAGWPGWVLVVAIGLSAMLAQVSMNQALAYLTAPKMGVIMTLEVVGAAAFGILYLDEPLTWRFVIGASLIVGCGALINLQGRFKRSEA